MNSMAIAAGAYNMTGHAHGLRAIAMAPNWSYTGRNVGVGEGWDMDIRSTGVVTAPSTQNSGRTDAKPPVAISGTRSDTPGPKTKKGSSTVEAAGSMHKRAIPHSFNAASQARRQELTRSG